MPSLDRHLNRPKSAPFFKTRFLIIILTTMCPIVCYISRQNLAIAIVSMVKSDSVEVVVASNLSISSGTNSTLVLSKQPEQVLMSLHQDTCPAPTVINAEGQEELAPITITYGPKYDWDSADRGLLFQAFFITYVVCQIPGARLAEMIGAKWILATAAIGSSLISLLTPLAASTHLYVFALARAVMGVCQAALYPACYVLYTQWLPPRERSQALPMLGAGAYIGSIIASTTTGFFSEQAAFGWQWAFYMPGIICAIWSLLWVYMAASEPRQQRFISLEEIEYIESRLEKAPVVTQSKDIACNSKKIPDWFKIFTSQHIWAMVVAFLASNWAFTITLLLLPSYLNDILHIPPFRNGLINSVIYILFCLSSPIVGAISTLMIETRPLGMTHLQTRKFFQCTAILSQAICFILLPLLGCDTSLVLAVLYVQIVLFSFVNGGEVQLPSELSVDFAGTIYAIGNCVGSSTGFLVPEVHKWIVKNSHVRDQWNQYFYVASALTTIGAIIFLVFGKNDLQDFSKTNKTKQTTKTEPDSFFELSVGKTHSINEKRPKDWQPVVHTMD